MKKFLPERNYIDFLSSSLFWSCVFTAFYIHCSSKTKRSLMPSFKEFIRKPLAKFCVFLLLLHSRMRHTIPTGVWNMRENHTCKAYKLCTVCCLFLLHCMIKPPVVWAYTLLYSLIMQLKCQGCLTKLVFIKFIRQRYVKWLPGDLDIAEYWKTNET